MMATTNNSSAKWRPEDRRGYVIACRELEDFATNLRVSRAHRIAYLLRSIASVLDRLAGQDIDSDHLQLIWPVAREENHKQFRKLIAKMIDALRQVGEQGRRASRLTITRYLEILLDEPLSATGSLVIRQAEKPAKR